ncbi:MAG TPA: hypothetical protein VMA77_03815 [Solirubrobacteraceae bacterium]|jgi:hypothetical protein|nr:hypothetical protein [Solirubrobacteraceae bacterium]
MNARVDPRHQHLDPIAETLLERFERADLVVVAVGERAPADRATRGLCRRDQVIGATSVVVSRSVKPSSSRTR